jgi:Holliday junction resolvasome RuvABC endonuclease subunit
MKTLSLDQAATCGYAISSPEGVVSSGVIRAKGGNYHEKANWLKKEMIKMIEENKIEYVSLENVQDVRNSATFMKLSGLLFVLVDACMDLEIPYHIYSPSSWRSKLGIATRPRAKAKEEAIQLVEDRLNITDKLEDECEAICMSIVLQEALSE